MCQREPGRRSCSSKWTAFLQPLRIKIHLSYIHSKHSNTQNQQWILLTLPNTPKQLTQGEADTFHEGRAQGSCKGSPDSCSSWSIAISSNEYSNRRGSLELSSSLFNQILTCSILKFERHTKATYVNNDLKKKEKLIKIKNSSFCL